MKTARHEVVVAGHICLDIIPKFPERQVPDETLLQPGKLVVVGPAVMATGGAVSNTGIALNRLGIPTLLMGKVGDDLFGRAVLDILRCHGAEFTEGMVVAKGETTSYSVVISPPGVDRMFLHCPGANDTFGVEDVEITKMGDAKLFHFGYPPIMRRTYIDGGRELEKIFGRARQLGMTTSLDMSMPDPASEAGSADWRAILKRVLPKVDIFLPSLEEIAFMIDRPFLDDFQRKSGTQRSKVLTGGSILNRLAKELIDMGAAIVGIKLGEDGLYLQTSADENRIRDMGKCAPSDPVTWIGRELLAPCFSVDVTGTTGAGDSTIAGFLAGLIFGLQPEDVMISAVAVGAFNVEKADATSGIPSWGDVQHRIASGWQMRSVSFDISGWTSDRKNQIWLGRHDSTLQRRP